MNLDSRALREIERLEDENRRLRDLVSTLQSDLAQMRELMRREGGRCSGQ